MITPLRNTVVRAAEAIGLCEARVRVPWGASLWHDLRRARLLPERPTLFDVGANVGQTAVKMKRRCPNALLWCFEPCNDTFAELQRNTAGMASISLHQIALADRVGEARIRLCDNSQLNHLEEFANAASRLLDRQPAESVTVTTIDQFAADQSIARIDLLKIDAEGADLAVIRGARGLFAKGLVRLAYVEVGFGNSHHVPLPNIVEELRDAGMTLIGLYGQVPAMWVGESSRRLDHANALFAQQETVDA